MSVNTIIKDTTTIITEKVNKSVISNNNRKVFSSENIGTVIPKSALSNISLTSVPQIIQDAINQAKLDAKDLALADAILEDIKSRLSGLEDGIYTRTYIDEQITYLEEILSQKATPESVASIADARVALATENLAATSTVNALISRVGSSESAISNLSETINTKDTARAAQINEAIAQVNQNLANYSDAIELTVDAEGNIVAQKIESLKATVEGHTTEISDTKSIAQDANDWSATSTRLITDANGNITGFEMGDGSNVQSYFKISADKFIVANGTKNVQLVEIDTTTGIAKMNATFEFSNALNVPDYALTVDVPKVQSIVDDFESYKDNTELGNKWKLVSGTNTPYRSTVKNSGSYAMGVGSTTNLDDSWLEHQEFFPVNNTDLYRIRAKLRNNNSTTASKAYLGLVCYASDKVTKLNTAGGDSYSSSHYLAASSQSLTTSYTEYVGYFRGQATTGVGGVRPLPTNPAKLYSGTQFVRGIFIANYPNESGYMYIDDFVIEKVDTDYADLVSEAQTNYTNTVKQALIDGEISAAEASAIATAKKAIVSASGLVPCYGNASPTNITYDDTKNAFCLYHASDTTIGMGYPAFRVDVESNQIFKISIAYSASGADADGFYFGVCEYDAELPAGKTHISNTASQSAAVVQEDTRTRWLGVSNGAVTQTWKVASFEYTPTSTAKWASIVILNWSGMGTKKLYVKDLQVNATTKISWQSEVQAAIDNDTTTIDGSKIVTNAAFVNNLNATGGVLAETVTADTIYNKTFEGAVIKGALLESPTIKIGRLKIDESLIVITDYLVTVATRNANPSAYSDMEYDEGLNKYVNETKSTVYESIQNVILSNSGNWFNGSIWAYNSSNVGSNNKVVKAKPLINVSNPITLLSVALDETSRTDFSPASRYSSIDYKYLLYIGNHYKTVRVYYSGGLKLSIDSTVYAFSTSTSVNFTVNGISMTLNVTSVSHSVYDPGESNSSTRHYYHPEFNVVLNQTAGTEVTNAITKIRLIRVKCALSTKSTYSLGATATVNMNSNLLVDNLG